VVKDITLVVDALRVVLTNLNAMADSAESRRLREKAASVMKEAKGWKDVPPSVEQREALMKKVLGLHTAMRRLSR
jgi:hypothetical protein